MTERKQLAMKLAPSNIDKEALNKLIKLSIVRMFYIVTTVLGIARLWAYKHSQKKAISPMAKWEVIDDDRIS